MSQLRIGVDARELLGAKTGVGRYLGELLARWTARPDADRRRFLLYTPEPLSLDVRGDQRLLPGGRGTLWEQTTLKRAVNSDRPDVFFAPAYTAPLGLRMPLVVTIHDISFTAHPEWFRWREGTRRRLLTRRAARTAAHVITVSEFSSREIQKWYGVPAERITVVPSGVTPRSDVRHATRDPMALYVGSIFNRRHVPDLIAAFARARRDLPSARLVIVGENRTWPHEDLAGAAAALGVASHTEVRDYISDAELADLYTRAAVFGFLSEYEGFGFTPLEALQAGVPVVVLDTPIAREVYGPAATYVPKGNIDAAASALHAHLRQPGGPSSQLAHAPDVLARYSWQVAADRTLARLEDAAR